MARKTDIDVIIGGHDHTMMREIRSGTLIVKAGMDATHLGVTDLLFASTRSPITLPSPSLLTPLPPTALTAPSPGAGSPRPHFLSVRSRFVPVETYDADPEVETLVHECLHAVTELEGAVALRANSPPHRQFYLNGSGSRFRQTSLGAAIASSIRDELPGVDCCVVNGASIKGEDIKDQSELSCTLLIAVTRRKWRRVVFGVCLLFRFLLYPVSPMTLLRPSPSPLHPTPPYPTTSPVISFSEIFLLLFFFNVFY